MNTLSVGDCCLKLLPEFVISFAFLCLHEIMATV